MIRPCQYFDTQGDDYESREPLNHYKHMNRALASSAKPNTYAKNFDTQGNYY